MLPPPASILAVTRFRGPHDRSAARPSDQGTLVVEVDDPAIKVALDGEELKITGAGPQEVRLKPGSYELVATKHGKLIQQQVLTITKGDKQVVKVTVEPRPDPAANKIGRAACRE